MGIFFGCLKYNSVAISINNFLFEYGINSGRRIFPCSFMSFAVNGAELRQVVSAAPQNEQSGIVGIF